MTLTIGTGPFGSRSGGAFNFDVAAPATVLYFEDSPRRVRVRYAGQTVADSRRVKLLHERERLPVYYFPLDDVRTDLLEPRQHTSGSLHKGQASYWSVRIGDRVARDAAWSYRQPPASASALVGYVAFVWEAMSEWFEEDEQVFVHPRDPYHRIDVLPSSRHVTVSLDGQVLADTRRPALLFECGVPTRYYLPSDDVRMDLLVPSDTATRCPYKGVASYWSLRAGDDLATDLVWSYREPLPAVGAIAGRVCFFDEAVDVEVDGERETRPQTSWSGGNVWGSLRHTPD